MGQRRKRLEETAQLLRSRLKELEGRPVQDADRAIHEVAVLAVRATLTEVGRQLSRLAA